MENYEIRELSLSELENVDGGFIPFVVAAFAAGYIIGRYSK